MNLNPPIAPEQIFAKANPGKVNVASPGVGTSVHLSAELFKIMTGVHLVHVGYKGSAPSLTDLLGGQVQVSFATMPASIEFIRSGRLRAVAVTTATRSPALSGVPTVGEVVPGYAVSTWYGLCARAGTPREVIDKINKEINEARGFGRCSYCRLAWRFRQAHRRRNREVGQGDPSCQHQAGVIRSAYITCR